MHSEIKARKDNTVNKANMVLSLDKDSVVD
jgi:hypothetical protein